MIKAIADTNIWYAIGTNRINIIDLKKKIGTLCAAPLSILEIVKGSTPNDFDLRKKAAIAIIEHSDEILDELPLHLAKLWAFPVKGYKFDWRIDCLEPYIRALNYSSLITGFPDFELGKIGVLNMKMMCELHRSAWDGWENAMLEWAEKVCPGYKDARIKGKTKFIKKEQLRKIARLFQKNKLKDILTLDTVELARHAIARNFQFIDKSLVKRKNYVKSEIMPFINANIEYGLQCLSDIAPEANDYVDLMIFLYLQDNRYLLTFENRWKKIAKKVCPDKLVIL